MKKTLLILIITMFYASSAFAQDLTGLKICIDPGHGGHDASNDRWIPEAGFWESEGNFSKANYLKPILENLHATVILTRSCNTDETCEPALSERSAIANANNANFFHSIHSNATGTSTKANYTLLLHKGIPNANPPAPQFPEAKRMSELMTVVLKNANRTTSSMSYADWSFYNPPFNLGVLKNLVMPGTLSEGSFHDYIAEGLRLKSEGYLKNEAWAIARAFLQFYNKGAMTTGIIAGVVRNPEKTVTAYYTMAADKYQPVNKIKVTMTPGDRVYNGDSFNNGYFMFDNVEPGTYKLYFEAPDYKKDSATVTVVANQVNFADKNLYYDNYVAPEVMTFSPVTSKDSATAMTPVKVTFTRHMNKASVEAAFSIEPAVQGTFSWEGEDLAVVFTPTLPYAKAQRYTVKVGTGAKTLWDVPLAQEFSFQFVTNSHNRLNFVKSYPENGQTGLSTTLQAMMDFDFAVNNTGLNQYVMLYQADSLIATNLKIVNAKTVVLEPQKPLAEGGQYRIVIKGGLKGTDNVPMLEDKEILFSTNPEVYVSGTVIDSFEVIGSWKDGFYGPASKGIDNAKSTFRVTYSYHVNGKNSGRLAYVFTGAGGGVCQYINASKPVVNASANSQFGIWIYGDRSFNVLEYWFYHSDSTNAPVVADTIDWTGWKLVKIPFNSIPGTGTKLLNSIVVKQTANGTKSSIIYVDDAQFDIVLPVKEETVNSKADRYTLHQNYPNPFNPSTKIKYSIPVAGMVNIRVFDALGRTVATLINEYRQEGQYELNFNASGLPSGIYFYTINSGNYSETKKMMLLK